MPTGTSIHVSARVNAFSYAIRNIVAEARKTSSGEAAWRYSLARITSRRLRVSLDGQEVFAATNFWQGTKSPEDPYLEARDGRMKLDPFRTPAAPTQLPLTPSAKP